MNLLRLLRVKNVALVLQVSRVPGRERKQLTDRLTSRMTNPAQRVNRIQGGFLEMSYLGLK